MDTDSSIDTSGAGRQALQDVHQRLESLARDQRLVLDSLRRLEVALASPSRTPEDGTVSAGQLPSERRGVLHQASQASDASKTGAVTSSQRLQFLNPRLVGVVESDASNGDQAPMASTSFSMGMSASNTDEWALVGTAQLPQDWTREVDVRTELLFGRNSLLRSPTRVMLDQESALSTVYSSHESEHSKKSRFVLVPSSPLRLSLDAVTVLALFFDLVTLPVVLAWNLPEDEVWMALSSVATLVWSIDLVMSFRTGYYRSNMTIELRPVYIARRYLCGWFLIDLPLLLLDWVNLIATFSSSDFGWMRFAKINRLLKLVRLARIAKLSKDKRISTVLTWLEHSVSPNLKIGLNIVQIMLSIVYVNHVLACVWYWLGINAPSDTGLRWIDLPIAESTNVIYSDVGMAFQYLTALHWSLTQMTPGSMQVFPPNAPERAFNVVCLVTGFIVFGSMISTLSAETAYLRKARREHAVKLDHLQRYLAEKRVSHDVIIQVKKDVLQRSRIHQPLAEKDIELLACLSDRLRAALHCEICKPILMLHPMFRCALLPIPSLLLSVCDPKIVNFLVLAPGDTIFRGLETAETAYNITRGVVAYKSVQRAKDEEDVGGVRMPGAGTWMAEVALWLQWKYLGTAEAASVGEVFSLNAPGFISALNEVSPVRRMLRVYSKVLKAFINDCSLDQAALMDDINAWSVERSEFFMGHLPQEIRLTISRKCLSTLSDRVSWMIRRRQAQDLVAELESGRSMLIYGEDGEVVRMVPLVSLRLSRDDGQLLAQVAQWRDGVIEPKCQLPFAYKYHEEPHEVVNHLLEDLKEVAPCVQLGTIELQSESTDAREFGLRTKYLKSSQVATLLLPGDRRCPRKCESGVRALPSGLRHTELPPDGELLVVSHGGKVVLYTWMRPTDYVRWSSAQACGEFRQWLFEGQDMGLLARRCLEAASEEQVLHAI